MWTPPTRLVNDGSEESPRLVLTMVSECKIPFLSVNSLKRSFVCSKSKYVVSWIQTLTVCVSITSTGVKTAV